MTQQNSTATDTTAEQAGTEQAPAVPEETVASEKHGFPEDTPLSEMTPDQQAAYWKDKARKHEQRANARGDYDDIKKRLEETLRQHESEQEKAVREAREAGVAEAREAVQLETAAAMARMALRSRGVKDEDIESFVSETNLTAFVDDSGQVNDERLMARVDRYAGTAKAGTDWPGTGQDRRGSAQRESGSDLHERLYGSKKK